MTAMKVGRLTKMGVGFALACIGAGCAGVALGLLYVGLTAGW